MAHVSTSMSVTVSESLRRPVRCWETVVHVNEGWLVQYIDPLLKYNLLQTEKKPITEINQPTSQSTINEQINGQIKSQ